MKPRVPLVVATVSLLCSIGYLVLAREYALILGQGAPGPGLFPFTIGLFWLGVSLWSVAEAWREGPGFGLSIEWADRAGWLRILIVLLSSVLFIALLDTLGDLIVSFMTILVVTRSMGMKSPVRVLGVSIAIAVTSHLVFVNGLGVPLPQGFWAE